MGPGAYVGAIGLRKGDTMNGSLWDDFRDLPDLGEELGTIVQALVFWIVWGTRAWWSAIRSPSRLCRSQAVSMAAVVAMHAAVLAWGAIGDTPTSMLVAGAIVITTGWTAIAGSAAGRMAAHFKKPSTP